VVITDHGAFVLVNVYVPNAGDRPARARLPYKLRFLQALQRACDELMAQGREVLPLLLRPWHVLLRGGCLWLGRQRLG
jgi:exonuclease III